MASTTTNLGLTKPAYTDSADVAVINSNMDILDTKIGAIGSTSVASQIGTLSEQIASKEFAPANDDSLLTWLLANISDKTTLPFSFVKTGSNVMSDTPTFSVAGSEFTGVVSGNNRRMTVVLSRYANGTYQKWTRNIFDSAWFGGWEQLAMKSEVDNINSNLAGIWITPVAGGKVTVSWERCRRFGNIAIIQATVSIDQEIATGDTIMSGLPSVGGNQRFFNAISGTNQVYILSHATTDITSRVTIPVGTVIRFNYTYIVA